MAHATTRVRPRRLVVIAAFALAWLAGQRVVLAQASALLSPGPLSKAHSSLEGLANCAKCHEPGRQVAASRCLACHRPIAERIAARRGVHRTVKGGCVQCHSEHNGAGAELRPFDTRRFDHAAETGFALDGRHAAVAGNCAKCHAGRSFLQARPACSSCHADAHRGSLGATCTGCHDTRAAFVDARRAFDHSRARFQLAGAHRTVDCARCHVNKVFAGLRFASCTDCHKSPHRQPLGRTCTSCHDNDNWRTSRVDHARTSFPLRGRHEGVPCASCHRGSPVQVRLEFARCASCHADVHRGQFKEDCATCHQETGFRSVPFDHSVRTKFPLTGRHAGIPCSRCHPNASTTASAATPPAPMARVGASARAADLGASGAPGRPQGGGRPVTAVLFGGASTACSTCHADPLRGETGQDCSTCHTTSDFRSGPYRHDARLAAFFSGRHATAACADCHGRLVPHALPDAPPSSPALHATTDGDRVPVARWRFKGLGTACAACHVDVHQGQLAAACETCHAIDETRFSASRFSHAKTGFPLTGKHQAVDCARCHRPAATPARQPSPLRLPGPAVSQQQPSSPGRPAAVLAAWSGGPATAGRTPAFPSDVGSRFNRNPAADRQQAPQAVPPLAFKGMGTDCASCHADVHLGQLGTRCERCHTSESFRVSAFTHQDKALARFFVGTHATLACRACHKPEQGRFPAGAGSAVRYVGTGTTCGSCHASEDAHRGALGSACESCHEPAAWRSASRAFHKAGLFPLEGRHLSVACASCHVDGVTKGTPTTCYDCHWTRRQDDRYHTRLGTQCEQCHRPTSWTAVQWNHAASTGFQLNLAHQVLRCDNCHRNGEFTGTSNSCYGCHQAAFTRTSQPNHVAAGFPTNCEVCHRASQAAWTGATFDHRAFFPLVGAHAAQACASCHRNNVYAGTPSDCVGCHQADFQRTQNPNHVAAGLPTTCDSCHRASDTSWGGGSFNHASFFPLVGAHATQACTTCHKTGIYKGTPRDCIGCHQADYQRSQNPNHVAAGFPTTCDACHAASASTWSASFDHNRVFPLVGQHQQQACSACHRNNVYSGTPSDCYSCHQASYQSTRNPSHVAAGFPTACQSCHRASDSSWQQGRFNHTWFPITSGKHAGNPCSACHTSASNFAVFTCTTCHARGSTDSHHSGVGGYRYDSAACYSCHPSGRGD